METWEYKIIGINIEPSQPPNAKEASQKIQTISQEFLEKEFPEQYQEKQSTNLALQLQNLINIFGKKGWEHYFQAQIMDKILFYFKRRITTSKDNSKIMLTPKEESLLQQLDNLQKP